MLLFFQHTTAVYEVTVLSLIYTQIIHHSTKKDTMEKKNKSFFSIPSVISINEG